jgi:GNAT superfamily N-acetyltransferase
VIDDAVEGWAFAFQFTADWAAEDLADRAECYGIRPRRSQRRDPVAMQLAVVDNGVVSPLPLQRRAHPGDRDEIAELMRTSVLDLFPQFYDARQTASAAVHIACLDEQLIADGTYFVHELAPGELVACGGWSRRGKLHAGAGEQSGDERLLDPRVEPARVRAMFVRADWTRRGLGRAILESCERAARAEGFTRLALMATLPGEPLYRALGFRQTARPMLTLPDGVEVPGVAMERAIA